MTFTPDELRLLAISDRAQGKNPRRKTDTPGRPRTRPDTPAQQRRRLRALARYYANKNQNK
jgi:hypothetical protein